MIKELGRATGAALLLAGQGAAISAEGPTIDRLVPRALAPGKPTALTLFGKHLNGITETSASFLVEIERVLRADASSAEPSEATFRMTVPSATTEGIGAFLLATTNGLSAIQFLIIDSLPTTFGAQTNRSLQTAQALSLPAAVEANIEEKSLHFYRFWASKGQRLSLEVVAARAGSLLDPVVRLLDAEGRELTWADDAPLTGSDAQFAHVLPEAGEYFIEIRDTRYQGGPNYHYRLRLGDFPLLRLPFFASQWTHDSAPVPSPTALQHEEEPNDLPARANPIRVPTVVQGAFARIADKDYFEFTAEKDQRLVFNGKTRSLGWPCDLSLQVFNSDGTLVSESNPAGADEGTLTNTFKVSGTFHLLVEELNRATGDALNYQIKVEPFKPGFSLRVETNTIQAVSGGALELKVLTSRSGYDGPIELFLSGGAAGFQLTNHMVPPKTNETQLKAIVPVTEQPGHILRFSVMGKALAETNDILARASTLPALRKIFPSLLYPPLELDGEILLGVTAGNSNLHSPKPASDDADDE